MIDQTNTFIEIVDHQMAGILADKSEAERLQIAWGMWRSARGMLHRHIRSENPDWNGGQIQEEVNRRLSGDS
ncbi:MAG: hypothetical protein GY903_05875 [Fuerstiella sp.]|nr:hypothetical protein [Fuerstiella sp.]MCP4786107.1 hypothetical protein [Fuerstiella sp.]MCP4854002.1 hypothetical protein [Fuerstiella sp.]